MGQHRAGPAAPGGLGVRDRSRRRRAHADQLLLDTIADIDRRRSGRTPTGRSITRSRRFGRASRQTHRSCGTQVVDLHSLVLGWYDDRNLFHKIGYLVAAGRASFLELVGLARGQHEVRVRRRAQRPHPREPRASRGSGVAALTYRPPRRRSRALLLMNVETVRRQRRSPRSATRSTPTPGGSGPSSTSTPRTRKVSARSSSGRHGWPSTERR